MSQELFKVKPVQSYDEPHYFAAPVDEVEDAADEQRLHPLATVVLALLVFGLALGMIGCYMRTEFHDDDPQPDGGPDGDPPDPPLCDDGALRCADDWTVELCDENAWSAQSCDDYCLENMGPGSYSMGCNAEAEDPCQCEYDILDGIDVGCYPGDVRCVDDWTVETCEEGYPEVQSCHDWCVEQYGWEYTSERCDASSEDFCNCVYGMVDGGMVECTPGDIFCSDEETIATCDESRGGYSYVNCDEHCVELFGEGTASEGCDETNTDNPCSCVDLPDSGSGE